MRVIRLGDRTSHGGEVITAASDYEIMGKKVAREGDTVTCPIKGHGSGGIIGGDRLWTIHDRAVALQGPSVTHCGAEIFSSCGELDRTFEGEGEVAGFDFGAFSANQKEASSALKQTYDLFFHIKNPKTGASQARMPYKITLEDGREFFGTADENGFTEKVFSDSPQVAKLEVPYYDKYSNSNTHTHNGSDTCGC